MKKQNSIGKRFGQGLAIFVIATFFSVPSFAAEYISVKKDGVNIRSGPATNTEILWEVFKDFPLEVLKRKGKWIQIRDFEGDKGWIYNQLISNAKTVIVKVKTANMRVGAGKNYEIMATVKYGVVFKPVDKDGHWIKVSHDDGTNGWMYDTLLWPK